MLFRSFLSCSETQEAKSGAKVRSAGVVLIRQRSGKGNAIFVTLEDETGITNVLVLARLFELYRRPVMAARLMMVDGEVQRSPANVATLIASRVYYFTHYRKNAVTRTAGSVVIQLV